MVVLMVIRVAAKTVIMQVPIYPHVLLSQWRMWLPACRMMRGDVNIDEYTTSMIVQI